MRFIEAMCLLLVCMGYFFRKSKRQQFREYLGIQSEPLIEWKWGNVPTYLGLIIGGFIIWMLYTIWRHA